MDWKFYDLVACKGRSDKEAMGTGARANATWEIPDLDSIHVFLLPKVEFLGHIDIQMGVGIWVYTPN